MKYAAVGHVATNRLVLPDGKVLSDIMGGGGFYAYSGLLLSDPESLFIAGVGRDFNKYYGEWFDRNHASRDGLKYRTDYCSYNEIRCLDSDRYEESSVYGPVLKGVYYWESDIFAHDLEPYMSGLKGVHTSGLWENVYLDKMMEMHSRYGFKIMWELPPVSSITEKDIPVIQKIIQNVDIWALNKEESFTLFGVDSEKAAIEEIKKIGKPCLYHLGADGVYMISGEKTAFSPAYRPDPAAPELDTTGCTDSASAAALWAFCEGMSLEEICAWSSIVSGYTAAQYGPIAAITPEVRAAAAEALGHICSER